MSAGKLRVLHLGSSTGLYGAERWILALLKHLPADLVESVVAVIEDDPLVSKAELCEHAAALGIRTVQFLSHGRLSRSAIGQIREFILKNDIDVLHTHGYKTDIIGLLAVRGTSCTIISTPHGWSTDANLKLTIYELLDRVAFGFFDAIAPLSKDLERGLMRLPWVNGKVHLIQNGVDLSEIADSVGLKTREVDQVGQSDFVVGYIGRLVAQKDVATLVRAFSKLERVDKQLWVVGEGPEANNLVALANRLNIKPQTHFFGYRDDRISLLGRYDVFVLCSSREGCPRCLMEAMAAGVPVVAADVPGCRDLIEHNVTGVLFPHGNDEALSQILSRLAIDKEYASRLAEQARKAVTETYSAANMASAYFDLYMSLTNRDLPGPNSKNPLPNQT